MKLIPIEERDKSMKCWFCRTDKSVKYVARMVNTNPNSLNRFMSILVCNKCVLFHQHDFVQDFEVKCGAKNG